MNVEHPTRNTEVGTDVPDCLRIPFVMNALSNTTGGISASLAHAARQFRMAALASGLAWWLVVCLGMWLILCLADNFLRLPAGLRLPLAVAGAAVVGFGFARRIWGPARKRRLEQVALMLEDRYSVPHNTLINAYQFEKQALRPEEKLFADRTLWVSQGVVSRMSLSELWDRRRLTGWGLVAVALVLIWLAYAAVFPRHMTNACLRYLLPLGDVPPVGSLVVKVTPSEDMVLGENENLAVRVTVSPEKERQVRGGPSLIWRERVRSVDAGDAAGEVARMMPVTGAANSFAFTFLEVRRSFAFRVIAGDTYSRSVHVEVKPLPKIVGSVFGITPPSYTGMGTTNMPGPPASLSTLPGSSVEVLLEIAPSIPEVVWKGHGEDLRFELCDRRYKTVYPVVSTEPYTIEGLDRGAGRAFVIARGQVNLQTDNPPSVDFLTPDRNRFVSPGSRLPLELMANDDYGVSNITVTVRRAEESEGGRLVKVWTYIGPPGRRGQIKESFDLEIDSREFMPGSTYLVEAQARDFCPTPNVAKSKPIVLRVRTLAELAAAPGNPLANAMNLLRETVEAQKKANSLTENLEVNLQEALGKGTIDMHRSTMTTQQEKAREAGWRTFSEFDKNEEGKSYALRLRPLVEGEMPWVVKDIAKIKVGKAETLQPLFPPIKERQARILADLIALLGKAADNAKNQVVLKPGDKGAEPPPLVSPKEEGKEIKDELEKFVDMQKKIIEKTKSLMDKGPEDLSLSEEKILGDLAREEAKWATFFEEKLTDFSKLPLQDFADGALAQEFNEVYQEVKKASKSLYEKKMELAVPQEQSGLENAEQIVNNLERWLTDKPDAIKWNMEEPPSPTEIAMAELPSELEDIVGKLIDKEEEMDDQVEDVSSSWLDSIDKGAGWDAADGPISSMSAKGVTGNQLPNKMEIGGRSGEGRTGQSMGQMVEETAQGKGGRETPTRVTPTPFEQGSVEDKSKESPGGATGGGKLAGFTGEGLRGPTAPPQLRQKMARLSGQQAKIRQEAETLSLKLRAYHLPTGDLETSVDQMKQLESAATRGYGPGVRQAYSRVVDSLEDAKSVIRVQTGLRREENKLPPNMRDEIVTGLHDGVPAGYEQMTGEYFKRLAEEGQ